MPEHATATRRQYDFVWPFMIALPVIYGSLETITQNVIPPTVWHIQWAYVCNGSYI